MGPAEETTLLEKRGLDLCGEWIGDPYFEKDISGVSRVDEGTVRVPS
jgi:hypothetical protein